MAVLFFRRDDVAAEMQEKMSNIRESLKLSGAAQKYALIYSPYMAQTTNLP